MFTLEEELGTAWMASGNSKSIPFAVWVREKANDDDGKLSDYAHRYLRVQEAAPELLAALKYIEQFDGAALSKEQVQTLCKRASAAIAKAEGADSLPATALEPD